MSEQEQQVENVPAEGQDSASQPEIQIDESKLNAYLESLKLEQNLPLGAITGIVAAIASAVLWAVVTVATGYQIGYMAVAVGLIVGFSIRFTGKGMDQIFGIIGAVLALLGCVLGNFLSIVGFIADGEGLGYFEVLSLMDYGLVPELMMETFSPMDLLFYGIAIYEGYKFSFRQITEEDLVQHAT